MEEAAKLADKQIETLRQAVRAKERDCDHEWRVPPDWQSGYCVKCGKSSTQR